MSLYSLKLIDQCNQVLSGAYAGSESTSPKIAREKKGKNEKKIKKIKMIIMQFTNGSKQMSIEGVTPYPQFF